MDTTNEQALSAIADSILDGTPQDIVERYQSLPHISESVDFGWLDSNVVVVDTETTGLSYKHDELTQIAAARMEGGRITGWYVTFVNPGQPIPDDIVHMTGISDADVADAPTPDEALAGLAEFAGDALMVAHNAAFDKTFVTKHPGGYPRHAIRPRTSGCTRRPEPVFHRWRHAFQGYTRVQRLLCAKNGGNHH